MVVRIPFKAIQISLYDLLSKGQTTPVYDHIPSGDELMPYICLGELHGVPSNGAKTTYIHKVSQQLDMWSDQGSKDEINEMLDDVSDLITGYMLDLANTGYKQVGAGTVVLYQAIPERYEDKTSAYHGILIVEYQIAQLN